MRGVASAIISHEQTQLNRVSDCCLQTLDAVLPKDLRLFKTHNSCRAAALKNLPIHRYSVIIFYIFLSFGTRIQYFYLGIE